MPGDNRLIEVVPYDSHWPELFSSEAKRIQDALGDNCIAIHHIGSTSIPGLCAKPLIDIIAVVKSLATVDAKVHFMKQQGYEAKGEYGIAFRRYFQKNGPPRAYNVHIYEENSPEIEQALLFRDYLCSHPKDIERYGKLKMALAEKHPNDMDAYWIGKESFIQEILGKAGFTGYRMMQALTPREWEAYHHLHEMHGLKTNSVSQDMNHLNTSNKNQYHFVFVLGTQLIGAAHVENIPNNQATIRTCVIDEKEFGNDHETHFREWLKKWIHYQGRTFKPTMRN